MVSYIKNLMAYLFEVTFLYYLLPLLLVDTGISMLSLLLIVPVVLMVISFSYGSEYKKIDFVFLIAVGLLFLPLMFSYMNISAFVYCIFYMIVALVGSGIGAFLSKKNSSKTNNKISV